MTSDELEEPERLCGFPSNSSDVLEDFVSPSLICCFVVPIDLPMTADVLGEIELDSDSFRQELDSEILAPSVVLE